MEMKFLGVDTAAKISADAARILRSEGVSFACRYLVPNTGGTAWKALTAAEAADIRAAGLALMLCWETSADRMKGGRDVGQVDGAAARQLAQDMGIPAGTVVYFAADYAVPESDMGDVYDYLYAAAGSASPYRVGLYGSENVVGEMHERRACEHFWQCVGGSNMFLDCAKTIQYEWQGGPNALALAAKVGFAVDLDSAATLDGMWEPERPGTEAEDAHRWAVSRGIVDETMRDVSQMEIMLYRYFRTFQPADDWSVGIKD